MMFIELLSEPRNFCLLFFFLPVAVDENNLGSVEAETQGGTLFQSNDVFNAKAAHIISQYPVPWMLKMEVHQMLKMKVHQPPVSSQSDSRGITWSHVPCFFIRRCALLWSRILLDKRKCFVDVWVSTRGTGRVQTDEIYRGCHIHVNTLVSRWILPSRGHCSVVFLIHDVYFQPNTKRRSPREGGVTL